MMKIVLKNVGVLKRKVEFMPGALTIFTGGNNTGKTYAMYSIWALFAGVVSPKYSFATDLVVRIKADGSLQIPVQDFCDRYWALIEDGMAEVLRQQLPQLFGAAPKFFEDSKIDLFLDSATLFQLVEADPDYQHAIWFGDERKLDIRFANSMGNTSIAITALDTKEVPDELLVAVVSMMITNLILRSQSAGAFLLPAERGGLNLFYADLPNNREGIVNRRNLDVPMDQRDLMVTRHAEPLNRYIRFLRHAKNLINANGKFHDQAMALQRDIAKVSYKVSDEGVITAKPKRGGQELGIHLTSSTVKNLYGLWAWLESSAAPGAYLMIDEPELNLHPDNQRLVARLLARLVNRGIRVVISTHSDYIVREVNNMIMLGSEFPERADMEREFGYDAAGAERLRAEDVVAYHFTDKGVTKCAISPEFGVEVQSMDDAINRLNKSNSAIYYALGEKLHPMVESAEIRTD